jgi:large subunit ribosomal protein L16
MLSPRRVKFRKTFKHFPSTLNYSNNNLSFGSVALKTLESIRITSKHIEAARRAMRLKIKRRGRVWINVFPHIPVTSKPTEVRMGKGKGSLSYWCCPVKKGTILFELGGVSTELAKQALLLGSHKLPCSTKFIVQQPTL